MVEYFPTEKMWADVLNKPKQYKVFKEYIVQLMNIEVDYDDEVERNNMSDRISEVIPEEVNELNKLQKNTIIH